MNRADSVRIGVVGTGRIGALHAQTLGVHSDVREVVLHDVDPQAARQVADRLGQVTVDSIDELLSSVDGVVIAAITDTHPALVESCIGAGTPAFCEKPLAHDLRIAGAVAEAVDASGVAVQMGFQRRFDAGYHRASELVAGGGIGDLYLLRTNTYDPEPPPASYVARSGGFFVDCLIHDFDLVRYVSGREVVEVSAHGRVLVDEMFAEHDDVDVVAAVLHLTGGAMAVCTATRHDPVGHDVRMEVLGSADSVIAGLDPRTPLRRLPDDEPPPQQTYQNFLNRFEGAYRKEMDAFVQMVTTRGRSPCTVHDAVAAQRIAAACDRSLREQRAVRLEEIESSKNRGGDGVAASTGADR